MLCRREHIKQQQDLPVDNEILQALKEVILRVVGGSVLCLLEANADIAGNLRKEAAALKAKLAANRRTTPLFDTQRFTRHIEAAYMAMHERHREGLAPADIVVPA